MKTTKRKIALLTAGLLGASTAIGIANPAMAAPRNDVRRERRDVKEARREVKDAKRDLKNEQRDLRQERRDNNRNNRPGYNNVGRFNRNYVGTVTNVRSGESFDIRIGSNVFNVYTVTRLPRGLSVGDQVRVNGVQQYSNDIRSATATIIRNR